MSKLKNDGCFPRGHIPWNKGLKTRTAICHTCDKSFALRNYEFINRRGKFCSQRCRRTYKYKLANNFKVTPDMAELIGVIIGDGCINKYWRQNSYRIFISGNKIEDKDYMENYISKLLKKTLNIDGKLFVGKNGAYILRFHSESFRIFLHNLGIRPRKSRTVRIPQVIQGDEILLRRCLRGVADTDFTIIGCSRFNKKNYYPRITAQFASEPLVGDLENSLRKLGFSVNTLCNKARKNKKGNKWVTNHINLDGPHNLQKWIKLIGFKNQRIITRYRCINELGMLPPKTTLPQRIEMLGRGVVEHE